MFKTCTSLLDRRGFYARVLRLSLPMFSTGLALIMAFFFTHSVAAKPPAGDLVISMQSSTQLFMDFNEWCRDKGAAGPDGGFYHLKITNPRNQAYTGLQVALTAPNGVLIGDPIRYVGNLQENQQADIFFYIDYRLLRDWPGCSTGNPPVAFNEVLTATITSLDSGMNGQRVFTTPLSAQGMASSNAGGQMLSFNLPPQATVGALITTTIVYGYGNNSIDSAMFIQPAGNGDFNAACFRLVRSQVLASSVAGVPVGARNQIYFPSTETDNNDIVQMAYTFEVRCAGQGADAKPWSQITSGNIQKYNLSAFGSNPGLPLPTPASVENAVRITKVVSPTVLVGGGMATFTTYFENLVAQPVNIEHIRENMPSGMQFTGVKATSQVNPVNSTISPTLLASGKMDWYGYPQITYQIPASGTLGSGIPGLLILQYTTLLTSTPGEYTNWVSATLGSESTPLASASVTVLPVPTAVSAGSFGASRVDDLVSLEWESAQEFNTAGFMLYRRAWPTGAWQTLTSQPVPAQSPGSLMGAHYLWQDPDPAGCMLCEYRLDEVFADGSSAPAGTAQLLSGLLRFYLPLTVK